MLGRECEELGHDVELGIPDRIAHRRGIPHVRDELANPVGKRAPGRTRD